MSHLPQYIFFDKPFASQTEPSNSLIEGKSALLARKIEKQMRKMNLSKQQFAGLMDVQPSIITRWLSGSHNFTINTLFEIEQKLQFRLVDLSPNVLSNRLPQIHLHLSVDSATASVVNPEELICVVERLYQFGESQKHFIPSSLQAFNFSPKASHVWHFKDEF